VIDVVDGTIGDPVFGRRLRALVGKPTPRREILAIRENEV
jgi:hypothetical protein